MQMTPITEPSSAPTIPPIGYPYWLTVTLSARSPMGPLTKEDYKLFVKNEKPVVSLVQEGYLIKMTLKNVKKQEALRDKR